MRGRQRSQETAVKERKEKEQRKSEQVHVWENACAMCALVSARILFLCVYLCRNVCVCKCEHWSFPCHLVKECNALPQRKIPSSAAPTLL